MRILVRPQRIVVLPQSLDDFLNDTTAPSLPTPGEPKYRQKDIVVLKNGDKVELSQPAPGGWLVTNYPDRLGVREISENDILTGITTEELDKIAAYKEKQEAKAERYAELAERTKQAAAETHKRAEDMMDVIPFGQPMMPGHHSYKADVNFRNRIDTTMRKSFELGEKAEYYAEKAERAADPYAISGDDPEAILLLKQKILKLEELRTTIRAKTNHEMWVERGSPANMPENVWDFRKMELESLGRRINDAKHRVDDLARTRAIPAETKEVNGVRMVVDQDDNRVKLFFPGKPPQQVIDLLKRSGFHWSPRQMAWMRQISNAAIYEAEEILKYRIPGT